MNIDKIIDIIAVDGTSDYKGYDMLKDLLQNREFYDIICEGINEGKITGFPEDLWKKFDGQNIRFPGINSFLEVFRDGANLGSCTNCALQASLSMDNIFICGGVVPIMKGTKNCPDGSHTWILKNNIIIDTSLMLCISKDYASKIGYIEENRYNPSNNPYYCSQKEFTNDPNLNHGRKK